MRRLSNEDGRVAGARNVGRLALGIIPLALGLGASVWLGFWIRAHYFITDLSQEQRRAVIVGANPLPKSSMNIITETNYGMIVIDRVDYEGGTASVYFRNVSNNARFRNFGLSWQLIGPDGTLLDGGECDNPDSVPQWLEPLEKGEIVASCIHSDKRASSIRFMVLANKE
jgi:hypothetical protein